MPPTLPNIVFLFADQMRFCDVGFMGNPQVRTPNLDRLSAEGVTFTHAVSACPLCTPYRASLLTGRHALTNGMLLNDVRLPTDEVTIAHVLAGAGYDTAYLGKWHLDGPNRGGFTPPGPRRQGFDYWAAANCTHDYLRSFYYRDDPEPIWIQGYDADHFAELAVQYIHEHRARPFCLFLSWGPPHDPYLEMPPEYMIHDPADIVPRPNVETGERPHLSTRFEGQWGLSPFSPESLAGYYSHIAALDRNVGRITAALEEAGVVDETILVITSDHGDMLGSHGQRWKQRPWDESIRVPFVLRWPGRAPAGLRTDALLNVTDVMPTLLDLVGLPCPEAVQGESFAAAVLTGAACGPEATFIHNTCPFGDPIPEWRGVRTRRYTYVETRDGPWLLYDNEADPYQLRNLVRHPTYQRLQRELRDHLYAWLERLGDDFAPREVYWQRFGFQVDEVGQIPCTFELGRSEP